MGQGGKRSIRWDHAMGIILAYVLLKDHVGEGSPTRLVWDQGHWGLGIRRQLMAIPDHDPTSRIGMMKARRVYLGKVQ